jgi:hypothetical protein
LALCQLAKAALPPDDILLWQRKLDKIIQRFLDSGNLVLVRLQW